MLPILLVSVRKGIQRGVEVINERGPVVRRLILRKKNGLLCAVDFHAPFLLQLLTYLLSLWCRMLFKKLIVTQLVKKYPAFFM
jgi:hypothetical protein